ncbi:MAG TPA: ATP-binding cassette domain-containing protein [Negativicutes bacterium]|nr:ATP-binding cassette domain-containing protein [Negativicutes bacterium]
MLKIEQLSVREKSGRYLLQNISMEIQAGQVIGLTGHSGSGKTTLLRSVFGMLHRTCHIDAGKILLNDMDLSHLSRRDHRELCGKRLGFIPQNPMTAFDSRMKIGRQMQETFQKRLHLKKDEADALAKEKLLLVNLKDTARILGAYPPELSGGMLQRVAVAILLGMSPDYILADEPTAALDEENRDLLLLIMQEQLTKKGVLFVSHDVDALKMLCRKVYVLGAGQIIEQGTMETLLSEPETDWMKQFSSLNRKESRGDWKWEKL